MQAANYDTGGQGVAYNVTSVNGSANSYRSDGVDLEVCADTGCGYDIGWTAAGQWFKYTVDVATAGTYALSLRLAAPTAVTDALHISNAAGTNLTGSVTAPATGGYQNWTTVTVWAAVADPTASLPNDSDVGEAVSTGPEGFVVDIVMLCTMSGALALVTFSRRSAPPFCASLNCAPVSCTVAVAQVPVPGLVTIGPFW